MNNLSNPPIPRAHMVRGWTPLERILKNKHYSLDSSRTLNSISRFINLKTPVPPLSSAAAVAAAPKRTIFRLVSTFEKDFSSTFRACGSFHRLNQGDYRTGSMFCDERPIVFRHRPVRRVGSSDGKCSSRFLGWFVSGAVRIDFRAGAEGCCIL